LHEYTSIALVVSVILQSKGAAWAVFGGDLAVCSQARRGVEKTLFFVTIVKA
jgi:preprotein translocase subunit SecG